MITETKTVDARRGFFGEFREKTPSEKLRAVLTNIAIFVMFLFILGPIFWVLTLSLKETSDILTYPPKLFFTPTLDNYAAVLGMGGEAGGSEAGTGSGILVTDFVRSYLNSFVISIGALLISLVAAVPAAYAISRYNFKGKEDIAFTILSFRFAPEFLVIIPLFIIFRRIGLYDTYFGLMWVYQLITLPMVIWILRGDMERAPKELEDSYMLDGYKRWQAILRVTIPIVRPGLIAGSLLAFIFAWNNFIFGFVLASGRLEPATITIMKFLTLEEVRFGEVSAAAMLVCIPAIVFSLFARKHLVKGLSMGAVKQ